jgi:2-polyprenyl-3-methyl-5-hydroxy-6-metoxy-1,4-benzoquinol methylase
MFLTLPSELQKGRNRCRLLVEKLRSFRWETVGCCNVCGSQRSVVISTADRYGLPARTALCFDCGLFYLLDRFTAEAYSEFYSGGLYRSVSSQFNNTPHAVERIPDEQRAYAKTLTSALAGYVPYRRDAKVLDIGGSAGVIALEFAHTFQMLGTVIDPAEQEIEVARKLGLNAIVSSIEDYDTDDRYDLILMCRSIEHLHDLRGASRSIRNLLKPGGLFYCDIVDFMESCRLIGPPETVAKIDHCYWLTQTTAQTIFHALGFEIVSMNIVFGVGSAGYLLRACEPALATNPTEDRILKLVEQIHWIQFEWTQCGRIPRGLMQRFRHKAYGFKKRLQGLHRAGQPEEENLDSPQQRIATIARSSS